MPNAENLIPQAHTLTVEEASRGGVKSGESRRRKRTLREELDLLLANGDTQKTISVALIEKAMGGDTKAFEVIRDTVGEKPVEKVIHAEVDPEVISEVERMVHEEAENLS